MTRVETVGYSRASLTGLQNPCSSVSSVVKQEIVRQVKGLFALADQIEVRFEMAQSRVREMTSSLLARAFCGQLILQNLTDELAEKLLKRIQAQLKSKSQRDARK